MPFLGDINARVRGLGTHLLRRADLERLVRATDLAALNRELAALGYPLRTDVDPITPAEIELGVRRRMADQMSIVRRWSEGRHSVLAVVFEDEDRRSISALLRGADEGVAAESRLTGLVPTEHLPERALQTLASQSTIGEVVRLLVWWQHPLAIGLLGAATGAHPSLFELEASLHRTFGDRAANNARSGGNDLKRYVGQMIDLFNAWALLLHPAERDDTPVERAFIHGGSHLTKEVFEEIFRSEPRDIPGMVSQAFKRSALAPVFRDESPDMSKLEAAALSYQIVDQERAARAEPLEAAPILEFTLKLRAEALNLRRIIWGVALRAPSALISAEWVAA